MSDPLSRLRRFLRELKRRNVYKVAVAYVAVAFVVLQGARLLVPALVLPEWFYRVVVALALLGFPLALVLAWAFEMTPEGVRRTEAPEGEETGGSGAYQWIGLALVVLLAGGVWYATTGDGGEPAAESAATANTTAARTASTTQDTAGPPRIAVLPFENIARDTGDSFFAEGMHEEVLNQLSKVSGLEVISRTSVMQYAETNKTVQEISEELGGVNALLEGTVRRAGDQVRITTQLIGAPQDAHLWSNTYERALSVEQIFDIQADIADQIAGSLKTQLAGGERRRIEDAPTDDLAAYEAFLRGRGQVWEFWGHPTREVADRATRSLREAVGRDSSFADAYAWLAQAHLARTNLGPVDAALPWLDSARAAVERARRIDPDRAALHLAQAGIYQKQDSLQAEAEALGRTLELQPSHPIAQAELSRNLAERGELAEAVRVAREAVRLDPRRPAVLTGMGSRLRAVGLHDAAEAWYRHTLEIEPGYFFAYWTLALNELEQGRPERALAVWEDYLEQADEPSSFFFATIIALAADRHEQARDYERQRRSHEGPWLGHIELRLGHGDRGRRMVREAVEAWTDSDIEQGERLGRPYRVWRAGALAVLGQTEEALREVERVAEEGAGGGWLTWYPPLDTLRSDPRFQEIVRQVEERHDEAREDVRRMDLDLYPPGMEPDSSTQEAQTDG